MTAHRPTLPVGQPVFRLRAATGVTELAVGMASSGQATRPERVTALLVAALDTIAGEAATPDHLRRLSSGSREWLLQQVGALFRPRKDWFEGRCAHCGGAYDLTLDIGALPLKPEGAAFPTVTVETSLGKRSFDVPNGGDEEQLARLPTSGDHRRLLLALCGHAAESAEEAARFTEDDLDRIDAALDEAAFEPSDRAIAVCPDCGIESAAVIDPAAFAFPGEAGVLSDVHRVAAVYHWSEETILALPSRRRRQYLAMIRADRNRRSGGRQ